MTNIIIYHASCNDGFGAAWAAWKKFGDKNTKYIAANYGDDWRLLLEELFYHPEMGDITEDIIREAGIYIVDFSFPPEQLIEMSQFAKGIVVLDHHESFKKQLAGTNLTGYTTHIRGEDYSHFIINEPEGKLMIEFDLNRSGAGIAWDYFHPNNARPDGINLLEDRDLWNFKFGDDTRALHLILLQLRGNFIQWGDVMYHTRDYIKFATPVLEYHNHLCQQIAKTGAAWNFIDTPKHPFAGHTVVFLQCPYDLISDTSDLLKNDYDIIAAITVNPHKNNNIGFSLRSKEVDVSKIASTYFAGGGHKNAAGGWCTLEEYTNLFRIPIELKTKSDGG